MAQKHNKEFYRKSIETYGLCALGVHWNSKHTQYKRFEILTKFIKKDILISSIADVGCGFGEYYKYLELNNLSDGMYVYNIKTNDGLKFGGKFVKTPTPLRGPVVHSPAGFFPTRRVEKSIYETMTRRDEKTRRVWNKMKLEH